LLKWLVDSQLGMLVKLDEGIDSERL